MKMNSTQLNGYDTLDAIQKNNENTHLETEQNGNLDKKPLDEEDIKSPHNKIILPQNLKY